MKMIAPNIAIPIVAPIALRDVEDPRAEQRERDDRLGCATLLPDERAEQHDAGDAEAQDHRRSPGVLRAAPGREQDQGADAAAEQSRSEIVDAVTGLGRVQVELEDDDQDREHADREVDVEDPAPGDLVDEEAAEQRPGDRGDGEDRADQAHVTPALTGRDDVSDDCLRTHHQAAGAYPLEEPEADQLAHRLAETRQHRADEEDDDRREEHGLAPVHVAELAVDRRRDGRGEQVRRDDPRQVVEAAQVTDDRGQRRGDDRLVERRQEHAEHQRGEDRGQRASAQPGAAVERFRPSLLSARRHSRHSSRKTEAILRYVYPVTMSGIAGEQAGKRSHARRNHELLVVTAREVFAERGVDASLEEIARRAGLGIGTLYRHFSSRDALIEAVFERRIGDFAAIAEAAAGESDAWRAFTGFLEQILELQSGDRMLKDVLWRSPPGAERVESARAQLRGLCRAGAGARARAR